MPPEDLLVCQSHRSQKLYSSIQSALKRYFQVRTGWAQRRLILVIVEEQVPTSRHGLWLALEALLQLTHSFPLWMRHQEIVTNHWFIGSLQFSSSLFSDLFETKMTGHMLYQMKKKTSIVWQVTSSVSGQFEEKRKPSVSSQYSVYIERKYGEKKKTTGDWFWSGQISLFGSWKQTKQNNLCRKELLYWLPKYSCTKEQTDF